MRLSFLIVILSSVLTACASAPVQEMSDARQALRLAHSAGTKVHDAPKVRQAETSLAQAEQALELGDYAAARRHALAARVAAEAARSGTMTDPQDSAPAAVLARADAAVAEAERMRCLWHDTKKQLADAHAAWQAGDAARAVTQAGAARRTAELALNQAYLEKARFRLQQLARRKNHDAAARARIDEATQALHLHAGKHAFSLIKDIQ